VLRTEMVGHVGRDPETRYMPSGEAVTNFSVAHTDRWKDKSSGEQKESTEWVRWVAFGRQAEIIGQYVKQGDQIWLAGQQRTRSWDKDGQKHYSTEIRLKEFEFIGKKQERDQSKPDDFGVPPADDFDDDIPF